MIDNYLLEELVTFSQTQTLAKTAKKLMVTQPTITRGMQKLEEELRVSLFNRQPNKITLTKTGKLAAQKAQKLLAANQEFVTQVRDYARTQQAIRIGANAPGPLIVAKSLANDYPITLDQHFIDPAQVENDLTTHRYSIVFSNREIQTKTIESLFVGREQLIVNLDQFMYLANQQTITFKELAGLSFVVISDIGSWKQVIQEHIPDAKFLYQAQREALNEITKYSNFPYFSTNISKLDPGTLTTSPDRVQIPITDKAATISFYASYLKGQRLRLQSFLRRFIIQWPK